MTPSCKLWLLLVSTFLYFIVCTVAGDVCQQSLSERPPLGSGGESVLIQRAVRLGEDRIHVDMQESNGAPIFRSRVSLGMHAPNARVAPKLLSSSSEGSSNAFRTGEVDWWVRPLFAVGVLVGILLLTGCLVRWCVAKPPPTSAAQRELDRLRLEESELRATLKQLEERIDPSVLDGDANKLTDAELRRKVDVATVQADENFRRSVHSVIERAAPTITKAQKVKRCVENGISETKQHIDALVRHHATSMAVRCLQTLDMDDAGKVGKALTTLLGGKGAEVASEVGEEFVEEVEQAAGLPAAVVLAGLVAPLQLQFLASWSRLQLGLSTFILLMFAVVMAFDAQRRCGAEDPFGVGSLWYWVIGLACILSIQICCRLAMLASSTTALEETRKHNVADKNLMEDDDMLTSLRRHIIASTDMLFFALGKYDHIVNSFPSWLVGFLNSAHVIWGGVGLTWCIWNAVNDSVMCDAVHLRFVVHVYVFIYTMLLSFTIPAFILRLVYSCISCGCVQSAVLHGSKRIDEQLAVGIPLVSVLARAFFLRSVVDIWDSEKTTLGDELDELHKRKADLAQKSEALSSEVQAKHDRLHKMIEVRASLKLELEADGPGVAAALRRKRDEADEASARSKQAARVAAANAAISALARAKTAGVDLHVVAQRCRGSGNV